MVIDDFGSITNLPSEKTYTNIHFVSISIFPGNSYKKENSWFKIKAVPSQHNASLPLLSFFSIKKRRQNIISLDLVLQSQFIHIRSQYINTATLKTLKFQRMMNVLQTTLKVTRDFLPVVYDL